MSEGAILGTLSLIVWALVLVVTVKYVIVIMRADNRGEGGLLALTALVLRTITRERKRYLWIMAAGLVGAALFYGDGVITPAISVLSAVEGLKVATPLFEPYVVPIALVLLGGLFVVQRRGTAAVGGLFGPVMLVWFAVLALLGIRQILSSPAGAARPRSNLGRIPARSRAVARFLYAGRGLPRRDRGRDAVRRYGAFRPDRLAPGLAVARFSGAGAQLLRARGFAARRSERARKSLLPPRPRMGPLPAGGLGLACNHYRLAGGHLGSLLDHPAGRPARLPAAPRDPPHLRRGDRAGLRAAHQRCATGRRDHPRDRLSALRTTSAPPTASRSAA